MKFVCMKCETYMNFEKVEKPGEGSLGVFFGCPSCGARFTMVTNPGETQSPTIRRPARIRRTARRSITGSRAHRTRRPSRFSILRERRCERCAAPRRLGSIAFTGTFETNREDV